MPIFLPLEFSCSGFVLIGAFGRPPPVSQQLQSLLPNRVPFCMNLLLPINSICRLPHLTLAKYSQPFSSMLLFPDYQQNYLCSNSAVSPTWSQTSTDSPCPRSSSSLSQLSVTQVEGLQTGPFRSLQVATPFLADGVFS